MDERRDDLSPGNGPDGPDGPGDPGDAWGMGGAPVGGFEPAPAAPYAPLYIADLTPARLALVARLSGVVAPAPTRPFHYVEYGCGLGLSLLIHAATHPWACFVGIDALPAHTEAAQALADRAGLTNIRFVTARFEDLPTDGSLPELADMGAAAGTSGGGAWADLVAAHAVCSWVPERARRALLARMGAALRPGGLAYLSYDSLPGSLDRVGLAHLMRGIWSLTPGPPEARLRATLAGVEAIIEAQAGFFRLHPNAARFFHESIRTEDPRVLLHAYFTADYRAFLPEEIHREAASGGLRPVGSAKLEDYLGGATLHGGMRELLHRAPPPLRGLLRAYDRCSGFRKEVLGRAPEGLELPLARGALHGAAFLLLHEEADLPAEVESEYAVFALPPELCEIARLLARRPWTVAELLETLPGWREEPLIGALLTLVETGLVAPVPALRRTDPEADRWSEQAAWATGRLNAALVAARRDPSSLYHDAETLAGWRIGGGLRAPTVDPAGLPPVPGPAAPSPSPPSARPTSAPPSSVPSHDGSEGASATDPRFVRCGVLLDS